MQKVMVVLVLWTVAAGTTLGTENITNTTEETYIYHVPLYIDDDDIQHNETGIPAARSFNAWSVLWYVGSFIGLIAFFFVISFSEWCCKRRSWYRRNGRNDTTTTTSNNTSTSPNSSTDAAPPAYDLFAPPSYESIYKDGRDEKPQFDIYVVPVNNEDEVGTPFCNSNGRTNIENDNPPSYTNSETDLTRRDRDRNTPSPASAGDGALLSSASGGRNGRGDVSSAEASGRSYNRSTEEDDSPPSTRANGGNGRRWKKKAPQPPSYSASESYSSTDIDIEECKCEGIVIPRPERT